MKLLSLGKLLACLTSLSTHLYSFVVLICNRGHGNYSLYDKTCNDCSLTFTKAILGEDKFNKFLEGTIAYGVHTIL